MILGHKEHRLLGLAGPLGELLATAADAALTDLLPAADDRVPLLLVPVPSRPSTIRQRGHEPTTSLVRAAADPAHRARTSGARAAPLLRTRPGLADQAGLDAGARAANLAGAFRLHRSGGPASGARADMPVHVLVCDDVLTTGRDGRGGAARAAVGRAAAAGGGGGGGDAATTARRAARGDASPVSGSWPDGSAITGHGLASGHGVRPGPWLRRPGAPVARGVGSASRCQSQAKRST